MKFSISIIGAGLSGLRCAGILSNSGHDVRVFDKGRSVGGRCATRHTDYGPLNHGLQFLDASDSRLSIFLSDIACSDVSIRTGAGQPLPGNADFVIPQAGANTLATSMAQGLTVSVQTAISGIERLDDSWVIKDTANTSWTSDIIILAMPPAQAAAFQHTPSDLPLEDVRYQIQVAALMASPDPLGLSTTGPLDADGLLWITVSQDQKRAVVFADDQKSEDLIETDKDLIAGWIWRKLAGDAPPPDYLSGHRWRYSRVSRALGTGAYYNEEEKLGYCGDWFIGPNAGDAIESGEILAKKIISAVT
ncbi:MAG: NAD(P)-binding protein [Pseudomonadota bacterium]